MASSLVKPRSVIFAIEAGLMPPPGDGIADADAGAGAGAGADAGAGAGAGDAAGCVPGG